ncbi:MAG TPA: hypothetical protein PLL56_14940, partial [Verrucomicrobiota bacterium]|nr:hypothetical protein [Verrucomicrobiota bacterium]
MPDSPLNTGRKKLTVKERLREPHILAEMVKLSLNQSSASQKEFLQVLEGLAGAIRDMLENAGLIHAVEIDHR